MHTFSGTFSVLLFSESLLVCVAKAVMNFPWEHEWEASRPSHHHCLWGPYQGLPWRSEGTVGVQEYNLAWPLKGWYWQMKFYLELLHFKKSSFVRHTQYTHSNGVAFLPTYPFFFISSFKKLIGILKNGPDLSL